MEPGIRTDLIAAVREILDSHGRLAVSAATLAADDELASVGLTSHASVSVMLACEDRWDVEFPTRLLTKSTFATIDNLCAALTELGVSA